MHRRPVRIYRPAPPVTSSAKVPSHSWRIDWDILQGGGRWENPLMGWASSYVSRPRPRFSCPSPPPTSLALACWLEPEEETLRTRRLTPHRPSPQRRLRPGHPPVLHHRRGRHSLLVRSSLPGSAHRDPLKGERNRTDMLTVRAPAARSRATRTSSSSRTSRSLRRNPTPSSPIPIAFLQSELGD